MANRYWVGGTANWDATAGTKWATTSGGGGGAAVPTAADDVFFDAASGATTCTVTTNRPCRSLNCTGYTGGLTLNTAVVISIGDASGGALTLVSGMTLTYGSAASGWSFVTTSTNGGSGWGITTGGKTLNACAFAAVGGRLRFDSSVTAVGITHSAGTVDFNNVATLSCTSYVSSGASNKSLIMGTTDWSLTAALTFGGSNNALSYSSGASITMSGGNQTVTTFTGASFPAFIWSASGSFTISGAATFESLTLASGGSQGSTIQFPSSVTTTVTGALTVTGDTIQTRPFLRGGAGTGTQATISAGSVVATYANFRDINATGAASWTGSTWGDAQGNTGITFPASATQYAVGVSGTTSMDTNARWASSSGGSGGTGRVPLAHDDVVIDASSGSGTANFRTMFWGRSCTFTNSSVAIGMSGVATNITMPMVTGSLALPSGQTFTIPASTTLTLTGRGTYNLTTNARTVAGTGSIIVSSISGSYTLVGDLTVAGSLTVGGTAPFDGNGYNVSVNGLTTSSGATLYLRSGTWTLTGSSAATPGDFANSTIVAGTSTIVASYTGASTRTYSFRTNTFYNFELTPGGAGIASCTATAAVFTRFSCVGGVKTIQMTSGSVWTFGTLELIGLSGQLVAVTSITGGARVVHTTTTARVYYASLTDNQIVSAGNAYNSTNGGNNLGWTFVAGPTAFTASIADSLGMTDAVAGGVGVGLADPLGMTDASMVALGVGLADALGMTDSSATDLQVRVDDLLGMTDEIRLGKLMVFSMVPVHLAPGTLQVAAPYTQQVGVSGIWVAPRSIAIDAPTHIIADHFGLHVHPGTLSVDAPATLGLSVALVHIDPAGVRRVLVGRLVVGPISLAVDIKDRTVTPDLRSRALVIEIREIGQELDFTEGGTYLDGGTA